MRKIELLAPAGNYEAFLAAINNGADAVYLGGNAFNARAFANNFSREELLQAVRYAHLCGKKIYVTVNTLYYDEQFEELFDYVDYLYQIQIDALIIQDIGLFHKVKELYPDFELHMSTQASVHNLEGVNFFKEAGAKRVVLARENTIEEIKHICKHTDLEIEVFIHGALCMSYSGQCYMSSFIAKRSGNQGACGQPCRLPYRLVKDDNIIDDKEDYLLSLKDLCTIEHIDELIDAGVTSFKIEGRMKRPEYVASVVKQYRKAIDQAIHHKIKDSINDMKKVFYRGFTTGHIFHDKQLLTKNSPGNQGIFIGKVIHYDKAKKRVQIKLDQQLKQFDRITFDYEHQRTITKLYNKKNQLINLGSKNDIISIEQNHPVKKNTSVYKIYDNDFVKSMQDSYQKNAYKIPITMRFNCAVDNDIKLTISDGANEVTVSGNIKVQHAYNKGLDKDRIITQLNKLGNTMYECKSINVHLEENCMFPIKELNQLRRNACEKLDALRMNKKIHEARQVVFHPVDIQDITLSNQNDRQLQIKVQSLKQLEIVLKYPIDIVYFPIGNELSKAFALVNHHKVTIIPYTNFLTTTSQIDHFINSNEFVKCKQVLVGDYGALWKLKDIKECILDTSFNITNSYAIDFFHQHLIVASLELSRRQMNQLVHKNQVICVLYGKAINMILKHCPISYHYHGKKVKHCNKCKQGKFALLDRKHEKFELMSDTYCNISLLNCRTLYIDSLNSLHIDKLLLCFTNETSDQIENVLNDYINFIFKQKNSQFKTNVPYTYSYFRD